MDPSILFSALKKYKVYTDELGFNAILNMMEELHQLTITCHNEQLTNLLREINRTFKEVETGWPLWKQLEMTFFMMLIRASHYHQCDLSKDGFISLLTRIDIDPYFKAETYKLGGQLYPKVLEETPIQMKIRLRREKREAKIEAEKEEQERLQKEQIKIFVLQQKEKQKKAEKRRRQKEKRLQT